MKRFLRTALMLALLAGMATLGAIGSVLLHRQQSGTQSSDISQERVVGRTADGIHAKKSSDPDTSLLSPDPQNEIPLGNSTDLFSNGTVPTSDPAEPDPSLMQSVPRASTQAMANARVHGDLLLASGNAAAAIRQYRMLWGDGTAGTVTPDVRYRLSLCAEALGDDLEALAGYLSVAETDGGGLLKEHALLGQARVLSRQGHTVAAQLILRRWILSREPTNRLSSQVASDALYLLGVISASAGLSDGASRLWADDVVCLPRTSFDPSRHLPGVTSVEPDVNDVQPIGIHIVHRLAVSQPDTVALSGRTAQATIQRVIGDLCDKTGWSVDWSQQAEGVVRAHTVTMDFQEQGADFVLDWLLTPHGVAWRFTDTVLQIMTDSELTPSERQDQQWRRSERALLAALLLSPEHEDSPSAYLLLGNLSFQQSRAVIDRQTIKTAGEVTDDSASTTKDNQEIGRSHLLTAQRHYEHILQAFPRSSVLAEAWFNLAKVAMAEHDLTRTQQALFGAMDTGRGQPLESAALLLAGRTALQQDQPRDATRPLMRAVTLAADDHIRALSLLTLAAAHLLDAHPERANVALMEDRALLQADAYRDRAALLASLARFRAASTPGRRDRDGRALVAALSHLSGESEFGLHEALLMAEACGEVGLTELAAPLLESTVADAPPSPLRKRLLSRLVDSLIQRSEYQRAETILLEIAAQSDADASNSVMLRLAQLYDSQMRSSKVESLCHEMLRGVLNQTDRVAVLRLLGGVYAERGDHERAVLCYSGVMPAAIEPPDADALSTDPSAATLRYSYK